MRNGLPTDMSIGGLEVGKKIVELPHQDKHVEVIEAPDVVSIEAPVKWKVKPEWWVENHDIEGGKIKNPLSHDDRFGCYFMFDMTPKTGPMSGQRMQIEEVAPYTLENDKIAKE